MEEGQEPRAGTSDDARASGHPQGGRRLDPSLEEHIAEAVRAAVHSAFKAMPKRIPKQGSHSKRTRSPSTSSSFSTASSSSRSHRRSPPPKKRKETRERHRPHKRTRGRRRHKQRRHSLANLWSDSESSGSSATDSEKEEGELSGEDHDADQSGPVDRLFPPDLFTRMLAKVVKALDLESESSEPKEEPKATNKGLFPQGPPKPNTFPMPIAFQRVLDTEWATPASTKHASKFINKFYSFPEKTMETLRQPIIDQPIAALSSAAIIPAQGEGGPKDPLDKRVESALRRNFEASSQTFRASAANSIMARAAYLWAEELASSDPSLSRTAKSTLKKIALASAFAADASFDSVQLSARAMAASVTARRNIWLRHWDVDAGSQSRLVGVPFKGSKLFGEALDPILIENRDKRKVLPSNRKVLHKAKTAISFRPQRGDFRKEGYKHGSRWNKSRVFPKSRQHSTNNPGGPKPKEHKPS